MYSEGRPLDLRILMSRAQPFGLLYVHHAHATFCTFYSRKYASRVTMVSFSNSYFTLKCTCDFSELPGIFVMHVSDSIGRRTPCQSPK